MLGIVFCPVATFFLLGSVQHPSIGVPFAASLCVLDDLFCKPPLGGKEVGASMQLLRARCKRSCFLQPSWGQHGTGYLPEGIAFLTLPGVSCREAKARDALAQAVHVFGHRPLRPGPDDVDQRAG